MKRKIAGTAFRIAVSALLIAYVLTRLPFGDRVGVQATLRDGRQIVGVVVSRDETTLVLRPRLGPEEKVPVSALVAEAPALVEPGIPTVLRTLDLALFVPLAFLWLIPVILNNYRWVILLRVSGCEVRWRDAFRYNYVGIFFNNFMLGSTGGDLLKAYLVAQDSAHKTRAVTSIFVDRLAGIISLALVALLAIGFNLHRPELREAAVVVAAIVGCLSVGAVLYFSAWARRHPWVQGALRRLPLETVRREVDVALHLYRDHKAAAAAAIGLSLVSHLVTLAQAWGFSIALGVRNVQLLHFCSFLPVIMIASALPISIGGLGVGEAAYVRLFGPVGMTPSQAVTLSLIGRALNLLFSLPGGLLLAIGKRRGEIEEARRAVEREEGAVAS